MFETEIVINRFLSGYAQMLVADVADERLAEQPLPGVNHPAWILGHLAFTADVAVSRLGGERVLDADWDKLFGPGSKISPTRADYPAKEKLVQTLEERFQLARQLAQAATAEHVSQPNPNPRMRPGLPTLKDSLAFVFTGHFGVHLGQLSSWRRMIGLPPLF